MAGIVPDNCYDITEIQSASPFLSYELKTVYIFLQSWLYILTDNVTQLVGLVWSEQWKKESGGPL